MRQLIIHGNKKSIIEKAVNPEILVYTDDTSCTKKSMDITGDRIVNFKYKIDIDGTTILQDYGSYSANNVNLTNIVLPNDLSIGTHTLNITATQDDGNTITQSATINVIGNTNFARQFEGSDKVDFGNPSLLQIETGTLEILFKTNDTSSLALLGGKAGAWTMPTIGSAYANNAYHMASFAFEKVTSNGSILYLDGIQSATSTITSMIQINNFIIGNGFKGFIEEVRLWNRKLTQIEINNNKDISLRGDENGLIGYWRFSEVEGNMAFDSTTNGNFGEYVRTTVSTDTKLSNLSNGAITLNNTSAIVPKNTDYNFNFSIQAPVKPIDLIVFPNELTTLNNGKQFVIPIDLSNFDTITGLNII